MILGSAFGFIAGGWLAVSFGWRNAFIAMAIPGLVLALFAWFMPDYKNRTAAPAAVPEQQSQSFANTIKILLKNRTLLLINIAFGLFWMFNEPVAKLHI
jgi:predicted MFS family arabinose efflux permease